MRAAVALALLLTMTAGASRPRRSVRWYAAAAAASAMSFSFVDLADGSAIAGTGSSNGALNLGPVSRVGAASRNVTVRPGSGRFVVSTTFGITVNDPSGANRSATLLAAVPSVVGPIVRIDGHVIDMTGRAIATHVVPGHVSAHKIEIEVPSDTTEANNQLLSNVIFSVLPE